MIPEDFYSRLSVKLPRIISEFGTPFHIYDETGILKRGQEFNQVFSHLNFREHYAVKANPNPAILKMMTKLGFGFDCSSPSEVLLSEEAGASKEDIIYTANNTPISEFKMALDHGVIVNLDDITMVKKLPTMPELICFRYNPGNRRDGGNSIMGKPAESKYGVTHDQIVEAYRMAKERGAKRFGIHTMIVSNELNYSYFVQTVQMLFDVIQMITKELGITFEFINMGGGLGIPYKPDQQPLNLTKMASDIEELFGVFKKENGYVPQLKIESGRYITGQSGVLVVTVINKMSKYFEIVGVDASMSALMRPAVYGAYHDIVVLGKENVLKTETYSIVGALCENWDQFASNRKFPPIEEGDILIIANTGAHGAAMGFTYNARLRPQELLLCADGSVTRIGRAENHEDYIARWKNQS